MNRKSSRVTIYDIAQELNTSPSTVTRALNNQTCISVEMRSKVHEAARRLGYQKNVLAHGLKAKPAKIGLILRNKFPEYQNLIAAGARHACNSLAEFNASIEVCMLDIQDYDHRLQEKIVELAEDGCSGVIFTPCSPGKAGEIDTLIRQKNLRASTFYHDFGLENIDFYVCADNARAGRIAADLLDMCGLKKGDIVAYFTGNNSLQHHHDNYSGFMEMNERYGFDVRLFEHQDNEKIAYYATEQILFEQPQLKGIFCSTAVTVPVCKKLTEAGRDQDIVVIGTELLTDFVPYIENSTLNAAIFQNPYKIGYLSYKNMYDCINGLQIENHVIRINPQIVLRGNVSFYEERITNIDSEV